MGKFYAVAKGRNPGIYTSWDACKDNVHQYPGAIYKSFALNQDAQAFLASKNGSVVKAARGKSGSGRVLKGVNVKKPICGAISATCSTENLVSIYTDGATSNNGKKGATGGYGVYFGPDDKRNVSRGLHEVDDTKVYPPTNQRAELHALSYALSYIHRALKDDNSEQQYRIYTDSMYGKKCIETWASGWAKKNWKTSSGGDAANRDIIEKAMNEYEDINELLRQRGMGTLEIVHVRGHRGNTGNEAADRLAVEGARKMADWERYQI